MVLSLNNLTHLGENKLFYWFIFNDTVSWVVKFYIAYNVQIFYHDSALNFSITNQMFHLDN